MGDRIASDNLCRAPVLSSRYPGFARNASRGRRAASMAVAVLAVLLWLTAYGDAKEILTGPLSARVVAVHDGDTLTVRVRIWLGQDVLVHVRIAGIDAPELHGKCRRETKRAIIARDTLAKWVGAGPLTLSGLHYGKYAGRVIAALTLPDGRNAAEALIAAHLARAYRGGKRADWCAPSRRQGAKRSR